MPEIPTIEPFHFIRSTAFSERVQLANKLNEVIDAVNNIGDLPDLENQITEIKTKISELEESIGSTDTSLAELENQVNGLISEVNTMQTEIDGKLSSVPIGGDNIGGVKNGGNVTINADGTMNASGTGTGINKNVLTYADNKLKSTVNGVDSNEVEIVAGGGGVSSVVVTNPSPGNITVKVDGVTGNADIDTLASGVEVYGSEFPADSGNASAYIKLNDSISTGEIGKYTESGTSFIRIGNEDTRLLADTVELRNEVPDEGCKLTSGANGELLVNGVAMKNYTLPVGGTALGGVKNGGNVTIDAQGNMNAPTTPAYTLPVASANTLGGVKIGSGITVGADGTISVTTSSNIVFIQQTLTSTQLWTTVNIHKNKIINLSFNGTADTTSFRASVNCPVNPSNAQIYDIPCIGKITIDDVDYNLLTCDFNNRIKFWYNSDGTEKGYEIPSNTSLKVIIVATDFE